MGSGSKSIMNRTTNKRTERLLLEKIEKELQMAYLSLDVQLEKIEEARRESTHENMLDERDQENMDLDLIKEEGFDKSQVY